MRESVAMIIIWFGLANQQAVVSDSNDAIAYKREDDAERTVKELLPALVALEKKYPNDTEIQLGLGALYSRYATSERFSEKAAEQWQKVLKIDPNNHPAQIAFVKKIGRGTTARRRYLWERLVVCNI